MSSYVTRKTPGDTAWFTHDRFGMFIHWGLYSMPARHEWIKMREEIPEEKYDKYFKYFNPDLFDAREWARQAKAAGMKYAVLTTKHHEGFCMWDTQYSDYKCTNTPAGRDLVREYVDAFRAEGLHIGFYYSLIDWHHPQFPIDMNHPRRDDPDAYEQSKDRDMRVYAEYMRNQVRELLTNYGKIDVLWFDFSYSGRVPEKGKEWMKGKGKDDWEAEKLIALARELQPGIMIDNRTEIEQDLWTPEQYQPLEWVRHKETGELVVWEACQTFSGSWGYYRDETTWKSPEMLIRMLVNTVALGGNLLMNVGPTSRGYFDARAEAAKTFVKFVCDDPETGVLAAQTTGFFPVHADWGDIYADAEDADIRAPFSLMGNYVGRYYNLTGGWTEQRALWWPLLTDIMLNGADVQTAADEYVAEANANIG